jgi:sigma-E factor negative regulatory protein RseA
MSTEIKEQLSALMDGEAQPDAARFVLRSVASDPALAASWSRYHLSRDCLQKQPVLLVDAGFAAAVMARIDAETAAPRNGTSRWVRYLSGGAVAAAVAVVALMASAPRQDGATGRLVAGSTPGLSAVAPPVQQVRASTFNDSALLPSPQLAQPASATVGGDTFFAPGYDLRSQPSNGWRPVDPSLAVRNPNAPYVLLFMPAQPATGAEKKVQPRLQ